MYSSEVGLFDSFELRGKWWLPEAPEDRVHGTLTYSPAQRMELHLDGKFQDPRVQNTLFVQSPFRTECILGETVEEESVTLYGVVLSRLSSRTDSFIGNILITGERFSSASGFPISGALLDFTNLKEWAAIRLVTQEKGATADSYRVAVPTSASTLFTVRDTAPFKEMNFKAAVQSSFVGTSFSAQMRTFFDCDFQRPLLLRDAEAVFFQLGNLLSVLQGDAAYIERVRLKIGASDDPSRMANWFRVLKVKHPPVLSWGDMNLPLRALGEDATCLFGSWFTNASSLDPIYDLLVGTYGSQSERVKFRALTQALEAFHRVTFGGVYLSKESYKPIRDRLYEAIPLNLNTDFQERLKSAIRFGFQYSLRTRLKALLAKVNNRTQEAVIREKIQSFIDLTVRVRNYLTHFDETDKPSIVGDGQALYNLNQRLRALLIVLLLTHSGVPENKATDGAVANLNLARF